MSTKKFFSGKVTLYFFQKRTSLQSSPGSSPKVLKQNNSVSAFTELPGKCLPQWFYTACKMNSTVIISKKLTKSFETRQKHCLCLQNFSEKMPTVKFVFEKVTSYYLQPSQKQTPLHSSPGSFAKLLEQKQKGVSDFYQENIYRGFQFWKIMYCFSAILFKENSAVVISMGWYKIFSITFSRKKVKKLITKLTNLQKKSQINGLLITQYSFSIFGIWIHSMEG